jgi:hypothetical protein
MIKVDRGMSIAAGEQMRELEEMRPTVADLRVVAGGEWWSGEW